MNLKFSNILKKLREENNITQAKLAKDLNLGQATISHYEKDVQPTGEVLIKLASYFNVSTDYLLGLENEDFTKTYDYSIEKIKSDLAGDSNASAKLDMKNKIENITKDKKIPLEKLSNLSEEQINLIIQLAKTFNKN